MKKSTIGAVLLVAMVLTKAMLPDESGSVHELFGRSEALTSNFVEAEDLRVMHENNSNQPKSTLLASINFSSPTGDLYEKLKVEKDKNNSQNQSFTNNHRSMLVAEVSEQIDQEDYVMPMEVNSNTGYGLWKGSSEKIISKEDRDGMVPLDNGNTIMNNVSTLFPRIQSH
jgi:hypothetical protein